MYSDIMKNILILLLFLFFLHNTNSSPNTVEVVDHSIDTPSLTEKRQRIGVIDTGVNRSLLDEDFMCKDMPIFSVRKQGWDYDGHGTNVVGLIAKNMDKTKYCITSYSLSPNEPLHEVVYFLFKMQEHGVVGVNISLASAGAFKAEEEMIKTLTNKGVKIFVAAGNDGIDLSINCDIYPACYKVTNKNLTVVGNKGNKKSNRGKYIDVWIDGNSKGYRSMTGTSQSTAIATGLHFSK